MFNECEKILKENKNLRSVTKKTKKDNVLDGVNKIISETKTYIDVFSKLEKKNAEPEKFLQVNKKLESKF